MVDVSNLKKACSDVQDCIQNLDAEVNEALDMVVILTHGTDGGLACILQSISSKLKKITDDYIMDCINNLMDLEAGLQMYKEENTDMSNEEFGSLGTLPGLTMQTIQDSEGNIVELENKPKRKYKKKKEEVTLEDIFSDEDIIKI